MSSVDFRNIREDKITVTGKAWDDDMMQSLFGKKILQFQKCVNFWKPILQRGRELFDRYEGNIFTSRQKAEYIHNGIIPLEPPIAKAPVRALVGQTMKSRKSGQVVTERGSVLETPDNTKELETLNAVMKDMEIKTNEEHRITEAVTSAFVSCYWNVLMFDHDRPSRNNDGLKYKLRNLPWESCVFGPATIREPDGSDIKEIFFFDYRTIADLVDNYPDMKNQIEAHFDAGKFEDTKLLSSLEQWNGTLTADDKNTMWDVVNNAWSAKNGASGFAQVVMHLYPIKRKENVWVNIFDDTGEDFEMRPPEWDDRRWNRWVMENSQKYHGPYEREAVALWKD